MAFKSFATPGRFNPQKVQDQTQKMQQEAAEVRQGMEAVQNQIQKNNAAGLNALQNQQQLEEQNRKEIFDQDTRYKQQERDMLMQNYNRNIESIQREGQANEAFYKMASAFSSKAGEELQAMAKKREEGKRDAYAMAVYQSGITAEEAIEIVKLDKNQTDTALAQNQLVKDLVDRGVDLETIRYLQRTGAGGGNRYLNSKALMNNTLATAPMAFEELKAKPYETSMGNMSYNDALQKGDIKSLKTIQALMNKDFIVGSGLSAMNPQTLGTLAYPKINSYWKQENISVSTQLRENYRAEAEQKQFQAFEQTYQSGGIQQAWSLVTDSVGAKGKSRETFTNWFETKMKLGQISPSDKFMIESLPVTINGKPSTFGQQFPKDMLSINEAANERQRAIYTQRDNIQKEQDYAASQLEKKLYDAALADENFTDAEKKSAQALLQQFPGYRPKFFDSVKTVQGEAKEKATEYLDQLKEKGLLTNDILSKYPGLSANYAEATRQQEALRRETGNFKEYEVAIDSLVKMPPQIGSKGMGTVSETVGLMAGKLKRELRSTANGLVATGQATPQTAGKMAYDIVSSGFRQKYMLGENSAEQFSSDGGSLGGYKEFISAGGSANPVAEYESKIQRINKEISKAGSYEILDQRGSIFNGAELKAMMKNYGQPNWKPNPLVYEVAAMLPDSNPFEIINRQIAAYGGELDIPPVAYTPSQLALENNIDPTWQKLLKTPTPERSVRSLGSAGRFMPEVVRNGYGPLVQQASMTTGAPPQYIAALMEIESSFDPQATSATGAVGLMQIQQDQHPAYTGGKDPVENVMYGAKYYNDLLIQFGDPVIAAGAYNVGPNAMLDHLNNGTKLPQETINHMERFKQAAYKYGDKAQLQSMVRPSMQARIDQVSSVTFDSGQPGIDVFFEDKQFPAVLPGRVKDISRNINPDGSGYGNYIVVESTDPETGEPVDVLYAHFDEAPNFQIGDQIDAGTVLGQQGGDGSVQSYDGTIASIDFLSPAAQGSNDMTPYRNSDSLRRRIASTLKK